MTTFQCSRYFKKQKKEIFVHIYNEMKSSNDSKKQRKKNNNNNYIFSQNFVKAYSEDGCRNLSLLWRHNKRHDLWFYTTLWQFMAQKSQKSPNSESEVTKRFPGDYKKSKCFFFKFCRQPQFYLCDSYSVYLV